VEKLVVQSVLIVNLSKFVFSDVNIILGNKICFKMCAKKLTQKPRSHAMITTPLFYYFIFVWPPHPNFFFDAVHFLFQCLLNLGSIL